MLGGQVRASNIMKNKLVYKFLTFFFLLNFIVIILFENLFYPFI